MPSQSATDTLRNELDKLIQELPTIVDEMGLVFVKENDAVACDLQNRAIEQGNSLFYAHGYLKDVLQSTGILEKWRELVRCSKPGTAPESLTAKGYSNFSWYLCKKTNFLNDFWQTTGTLVAG